MSIEITTHQTAAQFLAAAVLDLFPKTQLLGGQGTSRFFYYDFHFPQPFVKDSLIAIEERMQHLIKRGNPLCLREMLSSNAASLFSTRGQNSIAQRLIGQAKGLVSICAIGEFLDYCPHPLALSWPFAPHFKLFDCASLSPEAVPLGKSVRIVGALAAEKRSLRAFLKQTTPPLQKHHIPLAIAQDLFTPVKKGLWIWLPKAESIKQQLIDRWQEMLIKYNFKRISSPIAALSGHLDLVECHRRCFDQTKARKLAEILRFCQSGQEGDGDDGLLNAREGFTDRLTHFFSEENFTQACISSLHFILEIPKILGFEFQVVLSYFTARGAKRGNILRTFHSALEKAGLSFVVEKTNAKDEIAIEIKLPDALGRLWTGPFLAVPVQEKQGVLICSAFGSMERLIALMLERYGKVENETLIIRSEF
ncbi:MAG TPA: hypothetical protein VGJ00_00745 [Rhabdochlamydiaceae bacterium]|jgi:threonyl-tRNA synthetase